MRFEERLSFLETQNRDFAFDKLEEVDRLLRLNRGCQKTLSSIIETLLAKISEIDEQISKLSQGAKNDQIEFYRHHFPHTTFLPLLKYLQNPKRPPTAPMRLLEGSTGAGLGVPFYDSSDSSSASDEDSQDFPWNFRSIDTRSLSRKTGHCSRKKPKSLANRLIAADKPLAAVVLEDNIRAIVDFFSIDLENLKAIDFELLVSKLNSVTFIVRTHSQLTVIEFYKALQELSSNRKQLPSVVNHYTYSTAQDVSGYDRSTVALASVSVQSLRSRHWSGLEDELLAIGVMAFGTRWADIAHAVFKLTKTEVQCRERFANMLDPCLKERHSQRVHLTLDKMRIVLQRLQGKRWSDIALDLGMGITDNEVLRIYQKVKGADEASLKGIELVARALLAGGLHNAFTVSRPQQAAQEVEHTNEMPIER